jgi:hypothetical protein
MKRINLFLFLSAAVGLLLPAWGQKANQTVTLSRGWNAVHLRVSPEETSDVVFNNWPVQDVYKVLDTSFLQTSQFSTDINEEGVPRPAFATWSRTGDRRLSFPGVSAGVYLCYSTVTTNVSFKVLGTPVVPTMPWHKADSYTNSLTKASYNLFGISMASGASVIYSNYMAGADFMYTAIGKIGGTSLEGPSFLASTPTDVSKASDGAVLALDASAVSDWPGAMEVTPQSGLLFGRDLSQLTLGIRNRSAAALSIQVKYAQGDEPNATLLLPLLYWSPTASCWTNLPATLTFSNVATNGLALLHVAIDRKALNQVSAAGSKQTGIFTITDTGLSKMMVKVPVSAITTGTNDLTRADWPAGLWVGEMVFGSVSYYSSDSSQPEDFPSGGKMKLRAIVHVEASGAVRLLQRVTLATSLTTNQVEGLDVPNVQTALYAGTQAMPAGATLTRISSAAMDIDNPVVEMAGGGAFGTGTLSFSYTIAPGGRSNPFHHPFHPDHDGLAFDFLGAAPAGDDIANYGGTIKPETFSIGNTIELTWAANPGMALTAWNPSETSTGTCRWLIKNVRRQGDVVVSGQFQLKRITPVGIVHLPSVGN